MNEIEKSLMDAERILGSFTDKLDELNSYIKATESIFSRSPISSFKYPLEGEYYFRWYNRRVCFGDGQTEKPFIEWNASTRWSFYCFLNEFVDAMVEELLLMR